jgi:ribosome-associated toxin RatA of RatAB toxin-antitoxin module
MKRGAAPILFIKITNPQPACEANDFVSDEDYANMILENWDKDTAFSLRSNMEIIEYKYENTINLEIIEALYQHIIYTLNPASFFDDDSTRLGGSDKGKLELMAAFIGGIQAEIEQQLNDLINPFFQYNSFAPGYRAEVTIPRMNISSRELDLKEAELGAVHGFLTPNECRERAGAEGLDEDSFKQLVGEWSLLKSVTGSTQVSTAAKTAFPDVVLRKDVPDADDLADSLETDLHQMIDEATRDIISTMRKARS